MAKATFEFSAAKEVTAERAKEIAQTNDAKNQNFNLDAEDNEELTLTGKVFESNWVRKETGKADTYGTTLQAEAKRADDKTLVNVPFGLFKSAKKLASGGEIIRYPHST